MHQKALQEFFQSLLVIFCLITINAVRIFIMMGQE